MRRSSEVPMEFYRRNGHAAAEIEDICADDVIIKPVEWLWRARIPKGKLSMFDGDPDLGKSVVTMDIAARVSTGRPFPDGAPCEVGNVLIVNVEDAVDDTIVPRLKAHGADLSRVFIFSSVPDDRGGTRLLELPQDIALLEHKVIQREISLLIIDPVLTMLGGDVNKDQDARKALTPVRDMAERTGVAEIGIRHLNKSVGLKAIQRGGGNMGLIGVARAGSFFAEHPDDERLRVMASHKSNLAEKPPSLSYRIVSCAVHNTARVEWVGVTITTPTASRPRLLHQPRRQSWMRPRSSCATNSPTVPCGRTRFSRTLGSRASRRRRFIRRRACCESARRRSASKAGSGHCPPKKMMTAPRDIMNTTFRMFIMFKTFTGGALPIPFIYLKIMKVMKILKVVKVGHLKMMIMTEAVA